jgi:hypothetical protein
MEPPNVTVLLQPSELLVRTAHLLLQPASTAENSVLETEIVSMEHVSALLNLHCNSLGLLVTLPFILLL